MKVLDSHQDKRAQNLNFSIFHNQIIIQYLFFVTKYVTLYTKDLLNSEENQIIDKPKKNFLYQLGITKY